MRISHPMEKSDANANGNVESMNQLLEPIAICGVGLRLPGNIKDAATLWNALYTGQDLRKPIPAERFNVAGFNDTLGRKGATKVTHGYFLDEDLGAFDASLFTGSKLEYDKMDPQIRKLLEVTKECLENAGEIKYRGKRVGCYVGTFGDDWMVQRTRSGQQYTGGSNATIDIFLANRLSYEFDFQGPTMVVKTGCSASLVALHEACRALQSGDCDAAIVGGTSLIMTPHTYVSMAEEGVFSPDGSCKPFDAEANGFARADAINAVYVKRLGDAIRDGNPIRAIIRNSGNNSNGRNKTLLAPDTAAQESLIRETYAQVGLDPRQTGYVECHGTGTPTGDPIEAFAVGNVFGEQGIVIGSVKSNLGHSEGASGLTSLIKAILILENETIPPSIKFHTPNPSIPFNELGLTVPVRPTTWPKDRAKRISVNSFGIGGSNAHVIIDSPSSLNPNIGQRNGVSNGHTLQSTLIVLSAPNIPSLERMKATSNEYINDHPDAGPDLAYTLTQRREIFTYRYFMILNKNSKIVTASPLLKAPTLKPNIVFVFTGQGAQWAGMGARLLSDAHFKKDITNMTKVLQNLVQGPCWNIEEELLRPANASNVYSAAFSQPLCTAVQIALVNSLLRCGIEASAAIGHSSGEIAAAYAAGALTMGEAITLAYYRGLVVRDAPKTGAMAAVGLGTDVVSDLLSEGVVIAAENSLQSTTVSGDVKAVEALIANVNTQHPESFVRRLQVDVAYHSHHMEKVAGRYLDLIRNELCHDMMSPTIPFYSTTLGYIIENPVPLTYWADNLVSRVQFSSVAATLPVQMPDALALEIGPHSQLAGPLRQIFEGKLDYIPTLIRNKPCDESLLDTIGQLFQRGVEIDFSAIIPRTKVLTDLAPYPWDHSKDYWYEDRPSRAWRERKFGHHALLGQRIPESLDSEPSWRLVLDLQDEPWLLDHKIRGDVIFPFAGYVAMAGEAVRQITGDNEGYSIRHITVQSAMLLRPDKPTELITTLRRKKLADSMDSEFYDFVISSVSGLHSVKHCEGRVKSIGTMKSSNQTPSQLSRKVATLRWYEAMSRAGYSFGPVFQSIRDIEADPVQARARAQVAAKDSEAGQGSAYALHPVTIDGCFQLLFVALARGLTKRLAQTTLPSMIEEIDVSSHHGAVLCTAWQGENDQDVHLQAFSDDQLVLQVYGIHMSSLDAESQSDVDLHAAARVSWYPHFDSLDISAMLKPPLSEIDERVFVEELAFIGMLEYFDRVKDLETTIPHLDKYRQWLRRELNNSKHPQALVADVARLKNLSAPERNAELLSRYHIMSRYPFARTVAASIIRTCASCEDIFEGRVDALQVLMEGQLLTNLYDSITFDYSTFFRQLSVTNPGLRVLEVGAGTGGTTAEILRHCTERSSLPPFERYTFTDVSASFFIAAKERFKQYDNIDYAVFDISQDPLDQGFHPGTYDVILAANVVHTVPSLQQSLTFIQQLLRPGGYLLMTETVTESRVPSFVFGNFPGWWMGLHDDREWAPYVSVDRWDEELKTAGFEGIDATVLDSDAPYNWCAAILAQVPAPKEEVSKIIVLAQDIQSEVAWHIKASIQALAASITIESFGQPPSAQDALIVIIVDLENPYFENIAPEAFARFQKFCRFYQYHQCIWLLPPCQLSASNPRSAQSLGAINIARAELDMQIYTLELSTSDEKFAEHVKRMVELALQPSHHERITQDTQYVIEEGMLKIGRVENFSLQEELRSFGRGSPDILTRLEITTPGILSTLHWREEKLPRLGDDEVEIQIECVGVNFRDVVEATGLLGKQQTPLGFESSGTIRTIGDKVKDLAVGDRVLALSYNSFATRNCVPSHLCIRIPDTLSFEEAASMPIAFATAIYGLIDRARLHPGQSVLIHSACGGVGHAAIQVCQHLGAKVFVTVGSRSKAGYIAKTFGISQNHIFHSRDESFLTGIMRETGGEGVDIVLNSLSGSLLHASWKCVAEFGQLIELGKRDLVGHGQLEMEPFLSSRTYSCVDVAHLLIKRPAEGQRLLQRTTDMFITEGWKMPRKIFDTDDIEQVFRYLQDGTHTGKVVVNMTVPHPPRAAPGNRIKASVSFDSNATYFLTGGLGGLGRSIMIWMADRGARTFVALSRSAGKSQADLDFIQEMTELGCQIVPISGKAEIIEDVKRAFAAAPTPIKGIFHFAMVQKEGPLLDLTYEDWTSVIRPKVDGAWNLQKLLQVHSCKLDFFVLASSVLALLNQPHESNYAAASTFLESFCQYRRNLGLPASILSICPILDVGFVADRPKTRHHLQAQGLHFLTEPQFLDFVELAILNQYPRSSTTSASCNQGFIAMGIHSSLPLSSPQNRLPSRNDPKLGYMHNTHAHGTLGSSISTTNTGSTNATVTLLASIHSHPALLSHPSTVPKIAEHILTHLLTLTMQEDKAAEVDIKTSPQHLGVDSLLGIELRRWWKVTFGVEVSVLEVLAASSMEELAGLTVGKLEGKLSAIASGQT